MKNILFASLMLFALIVSGCDYTGSSGGKTGVTTPNNRGGGDSKPVYFEHDGLYYAINVDDCTPSLQTVSPW